MDADVTFEVHAYRETRWEVVDVFASREEAVAFARENASRYQALKVNAEHYDPVRSVYVTSTVYRQGKIVNKAKAPQRAAFQPRKLVPQPKAQDLHTPQQRIQKVEEPGWMDRLRAIFAS
jgi:hypothetical protein